MKDPIDESQIAGFESHPLKPLLESKNYHLMEKYKPANRIDYYIEPFCDEMNFLNIVMEMEIKTIFLNFETSRSYYLMKEIIECPKDVFEQLQAIWDEEDLSTLTIDCDGKAAAVVIRNYNDLSENKKTLAEWQEIIFDNNFVYGMLSENRNYEYKTILNQGEGWDWFFRWKETMDDNTLDDFEQGSKLIFIKKENIDDEYKEHILDLVVNDYNVIVVCKNELTFLKDSFTKDKIENWNVYYNYEIKKEL